MATKSSDRASNEALLVLVTVALTYLGTKNALFFAAAMICMAVMLLQRPSQQLSGYALFVFALLYFAVVFAYDIGKGRSLRDNQVASVSAAAQLSKR